MPFVEFDANKKIEELCASDPEFKAIHEKNEQEYKMISEIIALKKERREVVLPITEEDERKSGLYVAISLCSLVLAMMLPCLPAVVTIALQVLAVILILYGTSKVRFGLSKDQKELEYGQRTLCCLFIIPAMLCWVLIWFFGSSIAVLSDIVSDFYPGVVNIYSANNLFHNTLQASVFPLLGLYNCYSNFKKMEEIENEDQYNTTYKIIFQEGCNNEDNKAHEVEN